GFPSYAGTFTSHAEALSQGYSTECDSDVEVAQTPTALTVKQLSYSCNDGTTWGFDHVMTFELRKPTEARQLAYDIYYNGTYVGFLNYSNSYAYIGLNQNGGAFTLALAQNKDGRRLEDFSVSSNTWELFNAKPSALIKK
ncbi:MAG: hypothetical protein ABIR96_13255, partial [Bdellovibrionota bacterium]